MPSTTSVVVTQVVIGFLGLRTFRFSSAFSVPPTAAPPALEVSVDGVNWSAPTTLQNVGPNYISLHYPPAFNGSLYWRILTPPPELSFFPNAIVTPQSGSIPYP